MVHIYILDQFFPVQMIFHREAHKKDNHCSLVSCAQVFLLLQNIGEDYAELGKQDQINTSGGMSG